jgi:2,4-dienoyl-CoA reductase-like NADH-dependent reductase (Old Yellow Enzyme family)
MRFDADLPLSENIGALKGRVSVAGLEIPNRLAVQPMEGADGTNNGGPSELTIRRYDRFAGSGAGLIWFEAVAVCREGRANPRQLWMNESNLDGFKRLVERMRKNSKDTNPVIIMQATHSGRYSKPDGVPAPIIAYNNPLFEGENPIPKEHIISDGELKRIEESYARITAWAMECGFDGMDVKACHRYLNSELFSAYERQGEYGGAFENRIRFFKNSVENARSAAKPGFVVTSRVNVYDGFPYPNGFGINPETKDAPDLSEPVKMLKEMKFPMVNITMGNPYVNPDVNRPTKLDGVERMYRLTKEVKDALPDTVIISSGSTIKKEKSPLLAAGAVEEGYADIIGFGRMAFAYPNFAKDMLEGQFDKKQVCVTCGRCTELMRGAKSGCAVRDKLYTNMYKTMISERGTNPV